MQLAFTENLAVFFWVNIFWLAKTEDNRVSTILQFPTISYNLIFILQSTTISYNFVIFVWKSYNVLQFVNFNQKKIFFIYSWLDWVVRFLNFRLRRYFD